MNNKEAIYEFIDALYESYGYKGNNTFADEILYVNKSELKEFASDWLNDIKSDKMADRQERFNTQFDKFDEE